MEDVVNGGAVELRVRHDGRLEDVGAGHDEDGLVSLGVLDRVLGDVEADRDSIEDGHAVLVGLHEGVDLVSLGGLGEPAVDARAFLAVRGRDDASHGHAVHLPVVAVEDLRVGAEGAGAGGDAEQDGAGAPVGALHRDLVRGGEGVELSLGGAVVVGRERQGRGDVQGERGAVVGEGGGGAGVRLGCGDGHAAGSSWLAGAAGFLGAGPGMPSTLRAWSPS